MFSPDREAALARLAAFVPRAGRHYAEHRNSDEGEGVRNNVSMLSPYLRHRVVTEEEVLTATLARHSLQASEKFVQEVFWRTYFKGYLEIRPQIWSNYLRQLRVLPRDGRYDAAISGTTGIDCFDAWVGELIRTGYLHNHTRMWFASIWIFTLRLPWELGAAFMYHHLLDGDPASNTLSWRWVAGLHTLGKTYLARADNISKYTNGRFSPKGLATVAPPLSEPPPDPPIGLRNATSQAPDGHFGLLLTVEDLSVAQVLGDKTPAATLIAETTEDRSDAVHAFQSSLLGDAFPRLKLADHRAIVAWCASQSITTLVTAYAPVGPTADQLLALQAQLERHDIALLRLRRRYDTLSWPHATKGFFALKEKIPTLLKTLNIAAPQGELF